MAFTANAASFLPVPALDPAIIQTQAPGYSRLLVKRRTPLQGSLFNAPPPHLPISIGMAYKTALGNTQYILKLFENLPMTYMQAAARAVAEQPDILSASVVNEHGKVLTGVEMTVPFPAIHTDQAFDLYVPRKGGQNAPVVLIIGCVGGEMQPPPGMPLQLILPFLASAAAEQYGAVVACMSPSESEMDLTHQTPAQITTLAARQAINNTAIQGVLARIGQLTGANISKMELVGGQTAVPGDGVAVALRYALTFPRQVGRLVLDGNQLPPLPSLPPASSSVSVSSPVQMGLTALLPANNLQQNPSWLQSVRQLAAARYIQMQASISAYQDCGANLSCFLGPNSEIPMVFSSLLGPPPPGTALLSMSIGPDRQVTAGSTLDLPELISGVIDGLPGTNASSGPGWSVADGSALPVAQPR